MTGFMATNTAGTIQSQLLYGGNVAGTSPFYADATIGGNTYHIRSGQTGANCSVTNETITDGVRSTFTYSDGGNDLFSVVRTMTRINNPTGSGQVYKIDFEAVNHTSEEMSLNLEMGMDVMFPGNDNPSFLMDDDTEETPITNALEYTQAENNIPGVINLFDPRNPYMNVQCIVNSHGATPPSYVKIGDFGDIMGSAWRPGMTIRDSMYSVGWDNITVAPGGTSSPYTSMYGVSDPMRNPILSQGQTVPVDINIQSSSITLTSIKIPLVDCRAESLGVGNVSVADYMDCQIALRDIDQAIDKVSEYRSDMGAVSNRLEHAMAVVDNIGENTQAAESRIRDTDMAKEMVAYSRHNILEQSGMSMLAQAGRMNEGVLSLLGDGE